MNSVEFIEQGIEKLQLRGWGQGLESQRHPKHCMLSCFDEVKDSIEIPAEIDNEACRCIDLALSEKTGKLCNAATLWNDEPGRTQEEVFGVLYRAVIIAKQRMQPCSL